MRLRWATPDRDDPEFTEKVFEDVKKHPGGMILARFQCDNFRMLKTEDKKLNLRIEELDEPLQNATIENELLLRTPIFRCFSMRACTTKRLLTPSCETRPGTRAGMRTACS